MKIAWALLGVFWGFLLWAYPSELSVVARTIWYMVTEFGVMAFIAFMGSLIIWTALGIGGSR